MTENNDVYKTILKNGNKEHNEKCICCFSTIWNKYNSVHRFILLSANSYCYFHILFMSTFTLYLTCFPFFLIDHNQKQVLLIKWVIFFWSSKTVFCFFQPLENGHIHNVVSTLTNVVKLDVENNSSVLKLSNVVNINVEIDNVDVTLFNVVNLKFERNFVSTLIWLSPTSRRHISLTTTLRQCWKVSWILTNIAKRISNFLKFIKLKTCIFSRIPLNFCFRKLSKRCW